MVSEPEVNRKQRGKVYKDIEKTKIMKNSWDKSRSSPATSAWRGFVKVPFFKIKFISKYKLICAMKNYNLNRRKNSNLESEVQTPVHVRILLLD